MSSLVFMPELSFTARCRWQLADYVSTPAVWEDGDDLSRPLWTEFDGWNSDSGWLIASRNYDGTRPDSFPSDEWQGEDLRQSLGVDTFWFGTYRHALGYVYEIRPAYTGRNSDQYPRLNYWLDVSRSGYLGFYPTDAKAGSLTDKEGVIALKDPIGVAPVVKLPVDTQIDLDLPLYKLRKGLKTPLWHIACLNPEHLVEGGLHLNLSLYGGLEAVKVRRLVENGQGYLNTGRGRPGVLLMCIDNPCVPPHPKPSIE